MLLYVKPVKEKEKAVNDYVLKTKEGELRFRGKILGSGSSRSFLHTHPGFEYVTQAAGAASSNTGYQSSGKPKCSACRWNEVTIYRVAPSSIDAANGVPLYVAYTEGQTIIPGESVYTRAVQVKGGVALVDALTVRTVSKGAFLPRPAASALATAAEDDDSIYDAFNDRPVI